MVPHPEGLLVDLNKIPSNHAVTNHSPRSKALRAGRVLWQHDCIAIAIGGALIKEIPVAVPASKHHAWTGSEESKAHTLGPTQVETIRLLQRI